jgi:hypothetical protein
VLRFGRSDYSYQPSELSELEDEFLGVDFDAGVERIDSFPSAFPQQLSYLPIALDHSLTDLSSHAEDQRSLGSTTNATYPLSPRHTSIPNTPSPRSSTNDLKAQSKISQYELKSQLDNSRFQPFTPQVHSHPTTVELTPDLSGSSDTSAEGRDTIPMAHHEHGRISAPRWGDPPAQAANTLMQVGGQYDGAHNLTASTSQYTPHSSIYNTQVTGSRDEEGVWKSDERTGQAGLHPEARQAIGDVEVPNLKEQEEIRRLDSKNFEVQEWIPPACDTEEVGPEQSYFSFDIQRRAPDDENEIAPLDDAASIHENRLVEGQLYYNVGAPITEQDFKHMQQSRHWSDAPMLPQMTITNFQPETANEAMKRFNDNSDAISLTSRAATWGTRRRSEPNLADFDGITDGSFLKKLAITKPRDGSRNRQNSIFDQGLARIGNLVRNRSDAKLKRGRLTQNSAEEAQEPSTSRHNSQSSNNQGLVPPSRSSFSRGATPSANTAFAAMTGSLAAVGATHARSSSVTVAPNNISPRSPTGSTHLGFAQKVMNRARSRSELSTHERNSKTAQSGIVDMWKSQGGPPVANLASPPVEAEPKYKSEGLDLEDEDDEDEDQADEGDMKDETEQEPIIPNYEGFKAHVRRLNPDIEPRNSWLVSRIAHQQEIRYKNLLDLRVKHSQAMLSRNCGAGRLCSALGTNATLLDAKGNPRVSEGNNNALQLVTDFDDNDSNPGEGALTDETFPSGVPMPPSRNLPAEFECQLCFKVKKFQKPSDWTKHVHEDVQPFTCTYDKCKEPKSFKRKADWVRHENERHRHLEWWICQVEDCRHPCYRKDNFLQHLVREHKLPEPKQKTKAAIKKARLTEPAWIMLEQCHHETLNKPQDEPCKFCGKAFNTWKKLTVHLAKHMEHISLPVLRLVEQRTVDANTIISPVEQILTPNSPMSKAKMESHSPFSLNSVSPHVPMAPQFTSGFEQPGYYPTTTGPMNYGMQAPLPHNISYDQSPMYPIPYSMQQMGGQPRGFSTLESNNLNNMNHNRTFGSLDSSFSHTKVEQSREFQQMDSAFSHTLPSQGYPQHSSGYSMPNEYVTNAPSVTGFQTSSMLGMSDDGYGYDHLGGNAGQNFQQTPMSRTQGSSSSYGHSPQNAPQNLPYYGHHS